MEAKVQATAAKATETGNGDDEQVPPPASKAEAVWWYTAAGGEAAGPATWEHVLGTDAEQVWREGMAAWVPVGRMEETRERPTKRYSSVAAWVRQYPRHHKTEGWLYADGDGVRRGPWLAPELKALVRDGEVDGLTLFWRTGMAEWTPAAEIDALRETLVTEDAEEDGEEPVETNAEKPTTGETPTAADSAPASNGAGSADSQELGVSIGEKRAAPSGQEGTAGPDRGIAMLKGEEEKRQRKKEKREREKLKKLMKNNTSVYVGGVPPDATEEEVAAFFSKCGVVKPDPDTGKPKVKLYRDQDGNLKGDGLVTFLLEPSVENATLLLHGADFRDGWKLEVTKAEFKIKGGKYIPRPKLSKGQSSAQQALKERMLGWNEGVDDGRGLRIVVLKHCFDPKLIRDPGEYKELEEDIEAECEKIGPVEKVTVFARNPEGAIVVKFRQPASAESCIEVMNGRFFDGRKLEAEFFDGKSDYRVKETEEERKERIDKWGEWLEHDQDG